MTGVTEVPTSYTIRPDVTPEMVWIDLETCGLRPEDRILEVGIKVTNRHGDEKATFQSVVGYGDFMTASWLNEQNLGATVHRMHMHSGLIDEVLVASAWVANEPHCGFSRTDTETRALQFLTDVFGGSPDAPVSMAGASVQFDRAALRAQMMRLHNWFHYRQYDVSTLIQLGKLAGHELDESVQKRGIHRAIPDIEDEISVHQWAMSTLVAQF